jgi:hypothetical protein
LRPSRLRPDEPSRGGTRRFCARRVSFAPSEHGVPTAFGDAPIRSQTPTTALDGHKIHTGIWLLCLTRIGYWAPAFVPRRGSRSAATAAARCRLHWRTPGSGLGRLPAGAWLARLVTRARSRVALRHRGVDRGSRVSALYAAPLRNSAASTSATPRMTLVSSGRSF